MFKHHLSCLVLATLAVLSTRAPAADAFAANKALGRGINLGNALEGPSEGAWGMKIEEKFFDIIKEAGFDSVRVPIKWSAHAGKTAPFTIDETFAKRVDEVVDQALARKLVVVVNVHHYDEMTNGDPKTEKERLLGLWKQIAERMKGRPNTVYFEILNEPHTKLTAELWNEVLAEALAVIRKTNPDRPVVVGPVQWNQIGKLKELKLPQDDQNLIVTFHYYSPFEFTHQGASWAQGSDKWLGRTWSASKDGQAVIRDFDQAAEWSKREKRPLFLGEFGAFSRADMDSRAAWTKFLREEAENRGFSWAYWEFGSGFSAYDRDAKKWREPLKEALAPKK